ncbi:MAG: orotidine-5'-phosphate decarboxylase [Phycisphaerales bacterium]|nr:orotidine-5'-phosphate decarboxylase [Phycisphaerales bacterium]
MPTTPNPIDAPSDAPIDELISAIDTHATPACVGIDPVFAKMPRALQSLDELDAIEQLSTAIIDACKGSVGVVKPQSACFERYGSSGYAILERTIIRARDAGLVVILDAKRGDIGSSAQHYAKGAADMGAHFITVSPYMGPSTIEPFLDAGLGVFALVRTSNADSDQLQSIQTTDGTIVAQRVATMISEMGNACMGKSGISALGAVVGATKSAQDGKALRKLMPNQMLLVPGVGAQGGTVNDIRSLVHARATTTGQLGVIVNASRSINYPPAQPGQPWQDAIRAAAKAFADELGVLCA